VEYEIDKSLGITSGEQVEKMGIDKYNAECRAIVMRYASEWERIITRLGRWIDFKNDYKTLNLSYMESVWWVISQLNAKGLLYRGFKVMPYSTAVHTPLSNFEASQAYKLVSDPAIYVTFPLRDEPATSFIAWTTTPWTLPSNMALTVHPTFTYVKVKDAATGAQYIVLESRLGDIFRVSKKAAKASKAGGEEAAPLYTVLEKRTGQELVGTHYVPLFDYFVPEMGKTAFRVIADKYVTDDAGTGVVHCAPAFGEDDYRVAIDHGVIERGGLLPCPVDDSGLFVAPVSDFAGQHVKAADKAIVELLKKKGRVYRSEVLEHQYPFCWRSDTPLIYRAVPSWFVRVEQARDRLLANSSQTTWVPPAIQEGRFHNWLQNARDWAISRNRYWGTPLPIWTSDDFEEIVVVGSVAELEKYAGRKITDLHRESIDDIVIPSPSGKKGVLRRVREVADCWLESGAMPYAQLHYPFENQKQFEESFPADFIAEGVDQTRGWFYTLMVLSTLLYDKPAFKNLVVNGLVLAEDGKKMSKRLKNYPDPMTVVDEHGADALRLYLINSPVVRAAELRFSGAGVHDVVRDVFMPWYNSYRFLAQMTRDYTLRTGKPFVPSLAGVSNTMDRWILASANALVQYVRTEMSAYRLYTVVPRLISFLTDLSNWYVRLNRRRLKGMPDLAAAAGDDDDDDDDAGAGGRRDGRRRGGRAHRTLVALRGADDFGALHGAIHAVSRRDDVPQHVQGAARGAAREVGALHRHSRGERGAARSGDRARRQPHAGRDRAGAPGARPPHAADQAAAARARRVPRRRRAARRPARPRALHSQRAQCAARPLRAAHARHCQAAGGGRRRAPRSTSRQAIRRVQAAHRGAHERAGRLAAVDRRDRAQRRALHHRGPAGVAPL
jgi:isoleucyl-tRNA synthetase